MCRDEAKTNGHLAKSQHNPRPRLFWHLPRARLCRSRVKVALRLGGEQRHAEHGLTITPSREASGEGAGEEGETFKTIWSCPLTGRRLATPICRRVFRGRKSHLKKLSSASGHSPPPQKRRRLTPALVVNDSGALLLQTGRQLL